MNSWKNLFRSLENNIFSPLFQAHAKKKCLIDTCLEVDKSEQLLGGRQRSNRHLVGFPLWYHNVKSRASSSIYYFCWVGWQDRNTNCFFKHWLTKCYITCILWLYFLSFSGWPFQSSGGGCGWHHLPPSSRWETTVSPDCWQVSSAAPSRLSAQCYGPVITVQWFFFLQLSKSCIKSR